MKRISNWSKTMIALAILLVLMLNPMTRSVIMLILPLGSGIDDLIFFGVLFGAMVLLLMKTMTERNLIKKIAEWFMK